MPRAYSEDLRWRAVWLHLIHGLNYRDVVQILFKTNLDNMVLFSLWMVIQFKSVNPREVITGNSVFYKQHEVWLTD